MSKVKFECAKLQKNAEIKAVTCLQITCDAKRLTNGQCTLYNVYCTSLRYITMVFVKKRLIN